MASLAGLASQAKRVCFASPFTIYLINSRVQRLPISKKSDDQNTDGKESSSPFPKYPETSNSRRRRQHRVLAGCKQSACAKGANPLGTCWMWQCKYLIKEMKGRNKMHSQLYRYHFFQRTEKNCNHEPISAEEFCVLFARNPLLSSSKP